MSEYASSSVGDYVVRPAYGGGWEWWLCLKGRTVHADTIEAAKAACQADFERRVLAEIEVVPLAWDDETPTRSVSGDYAIEWDEHHQNYFAMSDDDSLYAGFATEEEAIAACNAHNRRLILGELAPASETKGGGVV